MKARKNHKKKCTFIILASSRAEGQQQLLLVAFLSAHFRVQQKDFLHRLHSFDLLAKMVGHFVLSS